MLLLTIHAAATLALVGLIWTIQIVHYPLMADVGEDAFAGYHARHERAITWIVAPLMLTELVTSAWLVLASPVPLDALLTGAGLVLVLIVWGMTAFVAVPLHARLGRGFDAAVHERLVRTNWVRTLAWSARGVLALVLLVGRGTPGV